MSEGYRWQAERAAWIRGHRWLDRTAAARRAGVLASQARKHERTRTGLGDTQLHEGELPGLFRRWTQRSDDASSAAYTTAAYVLVTALAVVVLGLAWLVSWASYRAWDALAASARVRVLPYGLAAALLGALFVIGRPLGLDLLAIHGVAGLLQSSTGGWIGPEVLSRWWAAGIVSWLEAQVVLGLAGGGWRAWAWGWAAPAIRRGVREAGPQRRRPAPALTTTDEQASERDRARDERKRAKVAAADPTKIISRPVPVHTEGNEQ